VIPTLEGKMPMSALIRPLLISMLALSGLGVSSCSQSGGEAGMNDARRAEIEAVVQAYLVENPEVIAEALNALSMKQVMAELKQTQERTAPLIAAASDRLYKDERAPSVGPLDAPIQIVEFFDYNCSACQNGAPWVAELIERHGDKVRVIFKESPIFEDRVPASEFAARAGIAAHQMGRYADFHFALMEQGSLFSDADILAVARDIGLDADELLRRANAPELATQVDETQVLMDEIGASGTPTFIVNGTLYPGTYFDEIEDQITEILKAS
jgi:protein-disulfide isomerase